MTSNFNNAKVIYRATGQAGHTPGALFMMRPDDVAERHKLIPNSYELVTTGYMIGAPVRKAGMAHAGRLYHGDDGKLYVIYLDWSASELVS